MKAFIKNCGIAGYNKMSEFIRDVPKSKFISPLYIDMKRLNNGFACFCDVPVVAQALNFLDPGHTSSTHLIVSFRLDKMTTENTSHYSSTWVMHTYLKGKQNPFEYFGNMTGNVLNVEIIVNSSDTAASSQMREANVFLRKNSLNGDGGNSDSFSPMGASSRINPFDRSS